MLRAKYIAVRMMVPLNLWNRRLTRPAWKTKVLKNMRKMMMTLKRIAISWMLQTQKTKYSQMEACVRTQELALRPKGHHEVCPSL